MAEEFDDVITMGRTQLQDAVPIRLGQVFHGYASMVSRDRKRIEKAHREMYTVNLGGTAVGTAINVSDSYFYKIVPKSGKDYRLSAETGRGSFLTQQKIWTALLPYPV